MTTGAQLPNVTNLSFVEALYAEYLRDPTAVGPAWREYFADALGPNAPGRPTEGGTAPPQLGPSFRPASLFNPPGGNGGGPGGNGNVAAALGEKASQDRVDQMVRAYRVRGHRLAALDPLGRSGRTGAGGDEPYTDELDPAHYGFTEADLDRSFSVRTMGGPSVRTLREILTVLRNTYCRSIGVQFMHIDDLKVRHWLQERMEGTQNRLPLSRDEQLRILTKLTDAVVFEEFIQKKYVGAKRFSLEGGESLLPLLDLALERAAEQGVQEVVFGMAHRGRLNALANVLGQSPRLIFRQFQDQDPHLYLGRGDVKYHLGFHGDWVAANGRTLHVALCFNPSHLEFVNPVVLGRCRAKQDRLGDRNGEQCLAVLIHGDAAFAGEGIVQETLNLSELPAYRVGGTLHVIVNNQIGFTTDPSQGRSTIYATDVAKMLQSPIFHVNGEDPEAVATVVRLAMDFRQRFRRDVVIDMYCYRRHGHNEGDEPAFTQPKLYQMIEARQPVRAGYLEHLLRLGGVTREEADRIAERRRTLLEQELAGARSEPAPAPARPSVLGRLWSEYRGGPEQDVPEVDTGVPRSRLTALLEALTRLPEDFHPLTKARRLLELRRSMAHGGQPLDWATAEALALATLATEGFRVRMTGQDCERGTFSQRHAVLHDVRDERPYTPLAHLSPTQAPVEICNSPLSELGVLGFEYGYSIACPDGLVVWEAQFGDFVNAAQVVVDQFIVSAEDKWFNLSGLVLLLPHGLEGQGPEHSSARIERFLQLAAQDNIQIVVPTTPAQYFHVLRRQVVRPWRKPLIVMTPKSLLRHPQAVSRLEELAEGRFQRILPDDRPPGRPPRRVLLCCGKVYYDLHRGRRERGRDDVAILRIEQLYPLAKETLAAALAHYPDGTQVIWVQEEPENAGAWRHLRHHYGDTVFRRFALRGAYRPAAASPATGSAASHKLEQEQLVEEAFAGL